MDLSPETFIALSVMIFGLIHSLLARDFVKKKLRIIKNYHRFYFLIALLTLVLLILIETTFARQGSRNEVIIKNPLFGTLIVLFGGFFFVGGILQLYLSVGLERSKLIKTGFYAFSRHPIYLGGIVSLIGLVLFFIENSVHISFLFSLTFYLFVGSLIEDYYLLREFSDYTEYKNNCAKCLPWRVKHFKYFFRNIKLKKSD